MKNRQYLLENNDIQIAVKSLGAELSSLRTRKDNVEYLWQADGKYWPRHSPVLFPVVGRLIDKKYCYRGQEYSLGQHGFARDREFDVCAQAPDYLEFVLRADEASRQIYPFEFEFHIGYRLSGKAVSVEYTVINNGESELLFSLGAHPGFNIPLLDGERLEDYVMKLSEKETAYIHLLEGPHYSGKAELFFDDNAEHELNREMFRNDALVFKGLKSETVALVSKITGKGIAVDCPGWPYLGVWMPPAGAPFVCIEPWYGLADNLQHDGNLENKEGIIRLQTGNSFFAKFDVRPL